ncbi:hypothetical protein ILUMI_26519 [Ignelater luminosus]|uniref:Retroviral polymerase SH3-like domain-containing protein n=1 Tax=Ignelater luminosus TaxID=2038154 RepID=A0A8K0FXC9_IGNLU|nr:hypothetical protein ILUMI_26519 [Ignelater luminosus]
MRRTTVRDTSQQNGVAERQNLTLMDMLRSCDVRNRCPSTSIGNRIPYGGWKTELFNVLLVPELEDNLISISRIEEKGLKIIFKSGYAKLNEEDVNQLKVFGCLAWAHTGSNKKLDTRAEKCITLGYPEGVTGYRLWNMEQRKIIV